MTKPNYAPPYELDGNCLYLTGEGRQESRKRLCNFAPYILRQVTKDDGAETTTWVTLGGIHESGRELSEVTIKGSDLSLVLKLW